VGSAAEAGSFVDGPRCVPITHAQTLSVADYAKFLILEEAVELAIDPGRRPGEGLEPLIEQIRDLVPVALALDDERTYNMP